MKYKLLLFGLSIILLLSLNLVSAWDSKFETGLKNYWSFDETSGSNVFNYANSSMNGTTYQGHTLTSGSWVTGKFGNALQIWNFTTPTQYFNTTYQNITNITGQNWSINFWSNLSGYGATRIVMSDRGGTSYIAFTGQGTNLQAHIDGSTVITGSVYNTKDQWQMYTIVYNSSNNNLSIWQNGSYSTSGSLSTPGGFDANLIVNYIGTYGGITAPLNGSLDEFGIWNRSLTPDEIYELYNGAIPSSGLPTLNYPLNGAKLIYGNNTFNCSSLAIGMNVTNISIYHNRTGTWSNNWTESNPVNTTSFSTFFGIDYGLPTVFDWTCDACFGDGSCSYAFTNRTVNYTNLVENKITWNNFTISGSLETFTLNITTSSLTAANFTYNNTIYPVSINLIDGNYLLTSTFNVPSAVITTNKSFFWTFRISTGLQNSSIKNQTVSNVSLSTDCTDGFNFVNLTNYDEQNLSVINGTVEYSLFLFDSNGNQVAMTNGTQTGYNLTLCSSINLTNSTTYNLQLRYYGGVYSYETYNIQNSPTVNLPIFLNLYYLNSTIGTQFKINYVDFNYLIYPGAIIQIQRQYLTEDIYRVVEAPRMDDNGQATATFNTNNIKYKFIVINNGVVLDIFENIFPTCQNIVLGTCELNLRGSKKDTTTTIGDFTYTLIKGNNTLTLTYTIPSGTPRTITFSTVQNSRFLSSISTCNNSLFASGGTILCYFNNTVGDSIVDTTIYNSDGSVLYGQVLISEDLSSFFLLNNYFIGFVLLLSVGLMFIGSSVFLVIGGVIGLIYLGLIFLLRGADLMTVSSSIGWIVVALVIIVYYISKKEEHT